MSMDCTISQEYLNRLIFFICYGSVKENIWYGICWQVVDVQLIKDRIPVREGGGRFKGYNEQGFAFNRNYYPPIYKVVLEKKGKTREFKICTDNPPEINTIQTYRIERRGNRMLYY